MSGYVYDFIEGGKDLKDLLAEHGMQWPGRRGRAVAPADLDL